MFQKRFAVTVFYQWSNIHKVHGVYEFDSQQEAIDFAGALPKSLDSRIDDLRRADFSELGRLFKEGEQYK